jgi:dihydrofolate synthase / folylpolyglutamate synthase
MPLAATSMTSYESAIQQLSALIPELFTAPSSGGGAPIRRKFSLDQIGILAAALGDPHLRFPSVLIAGTNGKGSTASTLASIAQAAGLRVGLYTSPHLERVNERIKFGGPESVGLRDIPDETFGRLFFRVQDAAQELVRTACLPTFPSYFELLTALAFLYFAEPMEGSGPVDLAILEVGMGGRLDATNLVSPILSVITDISLDHQEWLGDSIAAITREKAGILRRNGILITLPQHPEANQALGEAAVELDVRGVSAAGYIPQLRGTVPDQPYALEVMGQTIQIDSPLHGAHQHRNLALAIAAAVELAQDPAMPRRFPITPAAIEQGIRVTQWPGRLETVRIAGEPEFLLDVAHNPAGAWALRAALNAATPEPSSKSGPVPISQVLIFACLRDKPLREMTQILFPIFDHVVLAPIHSPRATDAADLAAAAEATGVPYTTATTVEEAIELAESHHSARIVISGSLYLVGEARTLLLQRKAMQGPA